MPTREEIDQAATSLSAEERFRMFVQCGVHDWQALPTTDSGEHYCPHCQTIWTADGTIKNMPTLPPAPGQSLKP